MPSVQVERNRVGDGIVAHVRGEVRHDAEPLAGAVTIVAVEYVILEQHYRLALVVLLDVGDKLVEVPALHRVEEADDERVDLEVGGVHWAAPARERDCCHRLLLAMVIPMRLGDSRVTIGPPGATMMRRPVRALIPFSPHHWRKLKTWSSFKFAGTFFMAVRIYLRRALAASRPRGGVPRSCPNCARRGARALAANVDYRRRNSGGHISRARAFGKGRRGTKFGH